MSKTADYPWTLPSLHPFPARMAPELALDVLLELPRSSVVLDPMSGSGTVLRQASRLGHDAIGFDLDPLAVLMSSVATKLITDECIEESLGLLIRIADSLPNGVALPWIDGDAECAAFIDYWFGPVQQRDLRKLSVALAKMAGQTSSAGQEGALDVLRIAFSRIIITKQCGASLAWDVSHSRPHRVMNESSFDVMSAFKKSVNAVRRRLSDCSINGRSDVKLGDARSVAVEDRSIDAIVTSPPYLNAIDYMRGHRLSLIWLGYSLRELRSIRSNSIGAERGLQGHQKALEEVTYAFGEIGQLPKRYISMLNRYAFDLLSMVKEASRVLKSSGSATFVVGNSCLKNVFIRNSDALTEAASACGLALISTSQRPLPEKHRYLPVPTGGTLSKRMRTETILSFRPRR